MGCLFLGLQRRCKQLAMGFIKFLSVGGTATLLQYAILIALVETAAATPVLASSIGYVLSSVYNYLLNYYFTFESAARHHIAAFKFMIVAAIGLTINSSLVFIFTEMIVLHYLAAQVLSTIAVLIWNFYVHRHWTYKSAQESKIE